MEPLSWKYTLLMYLRGIGWAIVAALSFAIGIGLAIKIFNWLSPDINEWEEIKKGNIGVALILISLILVVGALIYKVI